MLSIYDILVYENGAVPTIVSEIVRPAIGVAPLRWPQRLVKRHKKGNGFSLNHASRQKAELQAFARLSYLHVQRRRPRLARR